MESANEMEGVTQAIDMQISRSRGLVRTTYSFAGGRLPGLVSSQEVIDNPPSMEGFEADPGYFSFPNSNPSALARNSPFSFANRPPRYAFHPPASTSTWSYSVQHAVVPASPTISTGGRFSTGGFSTGGFSTVASPMDFEADPNRKFGGFFVDPYSPKKNEENSNQMEDYPEIRQELKEGRKSPPYANYICDICKNSTVAEYGRHWIQQCPQKNPNPNTPYQGDRRSKGRFECICGNSFHSENVYANEKKLCKKCNRLITPTKMWAYGKPWDHLPHGIPDYKNPHHQ